MDHGVTISGEVVIAASNLDVARELGRNGGGAGSLVACLGRVGVGEGGTSREQ
jgi:hypothetical protein